MEAVLRGCKPIGTSGILCTHKFHRSVLEETDMSDVFDVPVYESVDDFIKQDALIQLSVDELGARVRI